MRNITSLQTDLLLYVSSQSLLIKWLPLLLDQMAQVYEAQTELDLNQIEFNLGQVEGILDHYRKMESQRVLARFLAVVISILALLGLGILMFLGAYYNGTRLEEVLEADGIFG